MTYSMTGYPNDIAIDIYSPHLDDYQYVYLHNLLNKTLKDNFPYALSCQISIKITEPGNDT